MSVATPSRVVTVADATEFDASANYLTPAVAPTLCETAVLVAAVGAGAAVAACAGYVANAWANNFGHHRGHHGHHGDADAPRGLEVAGGSVADLIDARGGQFGFAAEQPVQPVSCYAVAATVAAGVATAFATGAVLVTAAHHFGGHGHFGDDPECTVPEIGSGSVRGLIDARLAAIPA
ncbi:hypothetical protein SAMN04489727_4025 [Amycolatopsis tolypomycina]|uniref:Uncharacterized protein n=1 Tax=Amycolatopsis tolypomycina TaxID=208445 RepID=A0A1H4T4C6_9PSEU|nr:hypothetical protein [Amycolatopsis tolypomycina]SEC51257.1 hypothetical protein SAMN04489727_4025 [Amycolatopsis tolypomycina]